jgi:hypothetical protein
MLEQASSDVLILLDCCAAASSISDDGGNSVTELVAACGFETWAPGVGQHSFTRSLTEELKDWDLRAPISVAKLHSQVLTRIKHWKPRYAGAGHEERRKTPIYVSLANEGKHRSIHLAPMNPPNASLIDDQSSLARSSSSPTLEGDNDAREGADGAGIASSQSSLSLDANSARYKGPKVLISLALEEDQALKASNWLEWLRSVPAIAKAAHVEGIYDGDSSFLLLIVPVEVWDMLPASRAVNFLAFVNSRNLLGSSSNVTSKQPEVWTGLKPFASQVSNQDFPSRMKSNDSAYYGSEGGPANSSSKLLKYTTIFLVDDSPSMNDEGELGINLWSETVQCLKRCAAVVLSGHKELRVHFFNSLKTEVAISEISDLQELCNFTPDGDNLMYQYLEDQLGDQLGKYIKDFAALDSKQREVYLGLNLVIITGDNFMRQARFSSLIFDTARRLDMLGARADQVRIQFVPIGGSRHFELFFEDLNDDLRDLSRIKRGVSFSNMFYPVATSNADIESHRLWT